MKKKSSKYDGSFLADALPTFINEANEQTESLEQLLLQLEEQPGDRDLLDALFRCAHTVKGSAGMFGLDKVVDFTHHVETLLSRIRDGLIDLDLGVSTLLLQCNDQIRHLIGSAADAGADTPEQVERRADLVMQLHALLGASDRRAAAAGPADASVDPPADAPDDDAPMLRWHVSVQFGPETFRNGMDPLAVIAYLETLGSVEAIGCDQAAIPALDVIDAEQCHLAFEVCIDTRATREELEGAFSFVRDDCVLHLIDLPEGPGRLARLIEALPDRPRLGDILMSIGAVTHAQLQACLNQQAQNRLATPDEVPLLGELLQTKAGVHGEVVAAALDKQRKQRDPAPGDENRYIRVHADRLDAVINLLGELVIAGAGAAMLARQTRQRNLHEANQNVVRLIEEIRNGTLQLRMVPIGETFSRFRRVVRDTASQLGKEVTLEIVGGETELDKSMVERIADPLMHLVRNGLDHGLETPAERQAAGKPAVGRLVLSARHESGSVLIRIDDDGRGIHRERVLQRAWDRGLLERGTRPPDAEILKLIFEPGFSTAEQVTSLSGRGVGMDVVRRNIEALRGSVQLHSTEGLGTRIDIRLPLTLAIIDGFLVSVGASKFIFPLDTVVEVIENRPTTTGFDRRGRGTVELRGQVLPVVSLRVFYDLESPPPERDNIIVVNAGEAPFGIVVDALLGQHQTVIKPLGRIFKMLRGLSGSSILGNGEVALIADVMSLSHLAAQPPRVHVPASRRTSDNGPTAQTQSEGQAS
ncbi:CheA signal transduction histidine kinase [Leptothrix cholodnii SP-6]|uniref:Chemotaxis protein CheA n=1 Tax=Leptothrix cholodnii (strain ATCC 51168 / LMG 8142 / SP-6) TaxID=395495 RepID=B1XW80_LEPCP|nr:chemotaxis protein CheA [Leptothrix cholodnii]ACB32607.1 CheA signal transduction histidine kinase [Leptothrix cholodnii SP-6]